MNNIVVILSAGGALISAIVGVILGDWFWFGPGGISFIVLLGAGAKTYIDKGNRDQ